VDHARGSSDVSIRKRRYVFLEKIDEPALALKKRQKLKRSVLGHGFGLGLGGWRHKGLKSLFLFNFIIYRPEHMPGATQLSGERSIEQDAKEDHVRVPKTREERE
jgi:hypothetical protein